MNVEFYGEVSEHTKKLADKVKKRSYARLLAALDARGLTPAGDACEFCLSDAITSADEREYITKICIYVQP